jgi:hypothetical protein
LPGERVELVGYFYGPPVDGGPVSKVAIPPTGEVQEDSAGEGELAGLYNAREQPMTARPQVAQLVDYGVLFGAGHLSDGFWQGVGHSHTEGPKRGRWPPPVSWPR